MSQQRTESPAVNSTDKKLAVQWLNGGLPSELFLGVLTIKFSADGYLSASKSASSPNVNSFGSTIMRKTIIILTIIFSSCSTNQEQKSENISKEILHLFTDEESKFLLTSKNSCYQTNLSTQFDLSIDFKRYSDTIEQQDSCFLTVYVKDKISMSTIDSFSISSLLYYSSMFLSCDSMISYTTKFNADREIMDNNYGEIVVADLNFDGYDDIAVVNDGGGNGGPLYNYYIQTNDKKFVLDRFLTDSVVYFPSKINSRSKTLTTYVHAGFCGLGEHIYKLEKKPNIWMEKSHKIINICE